MAAIWLLEREVKHCTIGFYVDSQSALRDLDAVGCNKITVYRAKEALKELSLLNTVTLTWVKAHRKGKDKASEANERADAAARLATSIEPAGSIEAPLALAGAKAIIKAKIITQTLGTTRTKIIILTLITSRLQRILQGIIRTQEVTLHQDKIPTKGAILIREATPPMEPTWTKQGTLLVMANMPRSAHYASNCHI